MTKDFGKGRFLLVAFALNKFSIGTSLCIFQHKKGERNVDVGSYPSTLR